MIILLVLISLMLAPRGDEVRPDLGRFFSKHKVKGCFVLFDESAGVTTRYNPDRCAQRFLPASTFKIPNTLIGLETGVLKNETDTIAWDGKNRSVEAWNRDHDLKSAFRHSVVWYYQEVARRIGRARMQRWVDTLAYGNRNIGGGIDRFWLDGDLRISCDEQIDFLRRMHDHRLAVSARSIGVLRLIMEYERAGDAVLFAKTGWAIGTGYNIGWFVGWVERGDRTWYFATNITGASDDASFPLARIEVTRAILQELKIWP